MTATRQARTAITAIFLLNGAIFRSWAARIPAIRDRLSLSDGELGIALACIACGAVVAMPIAGAFAARAGSRPCTQITFALTCATTATVALASLAVLCALGACLGASFGSLDVALNAHGGALEQRYARPSLSGFHTAFSAGGSPVRRWGRCRRTRNSTCAPTSRSSPLSPPSRHDLVAAAAAGR